MNLKVPGAILPLGCAILSTRAITVRGVGTTPLRRTRVNGGFNVQLEPPSLSLHHDSPFSYYFGSGLTILTQMLHILDSPIAYFTLY